MTMAMPLHAITAIFLAFTISTTSAMPPLEPSSTSTPPRPTTLGPQCRFDNGTIAQGFKPGDMAKSPGPGQCGVCSCDQQGRVQCHPPPCAIPPCVDAKSPGPLCCRTCPNGHNCMAEGGTIVPEGKEVEVDGQLCTCSAGWGHGGSRDGPLADCRLIPTTALPACRDYSGKVIEGLKPGGTWKSESGCKGCSCDQNGQAACWVQDCWITPCVDSVRKPGVCCPTCPNGNNCRTPSGKVVKQGEFLVEGNTNCSCTANSFSKGGFRDGPQAECTISVSAGCTLPNGTLVEGLKPGDTYKTDPCSTCYCQKDGKMMCAYMACAPPLCGPNGHYRPEGQCCPRCREGPSGCWLPNGTVAKDLKPGDSYKMGPCTTCYCQEMTFKVVCMSVACAMPSCGDRGSFTPEGKCCPVCREDCEDTNDQCRYWAYNGECKRNPGWMLKFCKKSCNVCLSECLDAHKDCKSWADEWCEKNPVWMIKNCPKSCNACSPRNG